VRGPLLVAIHRAVVVSDKRSTRPGFYRLFCNELAEPQFRILQSESSWCLGDFHYGRPIHSLREAVGLVARRGLTSGQIICEGDLTAPSKPRADERWLFSFPNSVLSNHIGDVITVKGRWLAGDKTGFGILDYNATGRIYLNIPNPTTPQRAIIGQLAENQCVTATGTLQKSLKVDNFKDKSLSDRYFFNAQTVVLTKSQW
jgi:hypothetical protein